MAIFIGLLVVAAAIGGAAAQVVAEMRRAHDDTARAHQLSIASLFAPALPLVQNDPRALLAWQPLANTLRQRFPDEFAALDSAAGSTFPFSKDVISGAHARWTAEWLAWERSHDATYKLKALEAQQQLQSSGDQAVARAKVDAVEREKLDAYQRRYEEYIRVAKALQQLG